VHPSHPGQPILPPDRNAKLLGLVGKIVLDAGAREGSYRCLGSVAGALVTFMVFGFDFSLIALIGIILLIGIVKKNGIMLVDFAIEAQRHRSLAPQTANRRRTCSFPASPFWNWRLGAASGRCWNFSRN
jgi:hypothetical protein